jgi:hypothetical protein
VRRAFESTADTSNASSFFQLSQDGFFFLFSDSSGLWIDGEGFVTGIASGTLCPRVRGSVLDDILWLLAVGTGNANSDHAKRLPDFAEEINS